ncbi:unnamed protein product [Paramecium primaurelia]|uniref:Uncharacterized protein n=1 Tax=Paramecium primaurelia TaxID=5886 RepID=A0A8S1N6N8_PARPR|nr:unnamed protein product [Paramecium primaurelia]
MTKDINHNLRYGVQISPNLKQNRYQKSITNVLFYQLSLKILELAITLQIFKAFTQIQKQLDQEVSLKYQLFMMFLMKRQISKKVIKNTHRNLLYWKCFSKKLMKKQIKT